MEGTLSAINSDPIFSFSWGNLNEYLSSRQGRYLFHYLKGRNLSAKTCVLEKKYIDKDYMIDYHRFYSRSFDDHEKFTKRIHFFSEDFSIFDFKEALENNSIGDLMNSKSYLGFVVIRPIKNSEEKWLYSAPAKIAPFYRQTLRAYLYRVSHPLV